jgi:hypothetical protein
VMAIIQRIHQRPHLQQDRHLLRFPACSGPRRLICQ